MRTPRHFSTPPRARGINTLIGNGWLHESPRNDASQGWESRGRSAMRKCMFLPVPPHLRAQVEEAIRVSPAALPRKTPKPAPREPSDLAPPRRQDPAHDVRLFPAFDAREAARRFARQNAGEGWVAPKKKVEAPTAWWEDPIAIGSLLIVAPPIGLAAVWSSRRYSSDARWALTIVTSLMMCLVSALIVAVLAIR